VEKYAGEGDITINIYYWIALILKNGKYIRISDLKEGRHNSPPEEYISAGQNIANLIGTKFNPAGILKYYEQYVFFTFPI
jgi:hypothetical protein